MNTCTRFCGMSGCASTSTDDPVYTRDEVDVHAKLKNQPEHLPKLPNDCPSPIDVSSQVVLRKSGKVTDVTVLNSSGCSYDREAIKAVKN